MLLLVLNYAKTSLSPQAQINILVVGQLETCDWQSITLLLNYYQSPVYWVLLTYSSLQWVGLPTLGRVQPPGRPPQN